MFILLYCIIGLCLLVFLSHFIFKILDWIKELKNGKFKTTTAHFLSDLYKLKIKWSDLGEAGYVESLDGLIRFHGLITKEPKLGGVGMPLTNDALSNNIHLKNERKKELIEVLTEQGVLDQLETEFRG